MQPSAPRSTPRPTADHSRDPRHVRRMVFIAGMASLLGLGPALLAAQERDRVRDTDRDRGRGRDRAIPAGHLPPPGECRVWYDNRPAGQQPPPTSCGNARADAARNGGRVIYGGNEGRDERRRDDRGRDDRGRDDRRECDEKDRRKGECGTYPGPRDPDRRDRGDRDRDDRDGRYPDDRYPGGRRYPSSLPEMVWGVVFGRGERLDEVRQWVGAGDVQVRYTDVNRDGRPEAVTWMDAGERIVQRWYDDDRDGRADRVALYQNGRVVRIIQ